MGPESLHAYFREKLVQPAMPVLGVGTSAFLRELKDFPTASRQWSIDLIDGEMLELPRLVSIGPGKLVKAIPLLVKLVGKFLLVLPRLLTDVKLESLDYLLAGDV